MNSDSKPNPPDESENRLYKDGLSSEACGDKYAKGAKTKALIKFVLCSCFGFFAYFVAFSFNGRQSILIDHIATVIKDLLGHTAPYLCMLMAIAGAVLPFIQKSRNSSVSNSVFSVFKVMGIPIGVMYLLNLGPSLLFRQDMLPFLYEKLVMNLSFVIPIGGALIIFLTDFGLMEFIGVFAGPIMGRFFKTPGTSAIAALASIVGSYSIALIITEGQYKKGFYTKKESAVIATGFSVVAATICIVVASTLGLMEMWSLFFWSALLITFAVTAITARLYPLRNIPDVFKEGTEKSGATTASAVSFRAAVEEAVASSAKSDHILKKLWTNFTKSLIITMGLTPAVLSIGLIGLVLAELTPVFDIIAYLFYPITWLLRFSDAHLVAKAASMSIAEMLLPAAIVAESDVVTRYVIGVVSISEVLFLSGSIPCIIATGIPVSFKDMLIIWYERVVLTFIIATPVAWILFT